MEELTEMRAKIERLESENGRIRIRLREYAELESYRKDIGRL
jgi:hypothetical protein